MTKKRQGSAITKTRGRCPNAPVTGYDNCMAHEPSMKDRVAQGRYNGGKGKSNAARARKAILADLRDIGDLLLQAIHAVKTGVLDVSKAGAIATLTRAYVAVYEAGLVDSRLKELEGRLEARADPLSDREESA